MGGTGERAHGSGLLPVRTPGAEPQARHPRWNQGAGDLQGQAEGRRPPPSPMRSPRPRRWRRARPSRRQKPCPLRWPSPHTQRSSAPRSRLRARLRQSARICGRRTSASQRLPLPGNKLFQRSRDADVAVDVHRRGCLRIHLTARLEVAHQRAHGRPAVGAVA